LGADAFANLVAALEAELGEGVLVRSDDVVGNEVSGEARPASGEPRRFLATFDDDGELLACELEAAAG
jgi:hypothetical protein